MSSGKNIIAIGGGKGGIGKSLISSSLAICIARLGRSVTLVDLDLGSANLHTCLGLKIPQYSLSDFLKGRVSNFDDILTPTPLRNLHFVCGFNDALDIADIDSSQVRKILENIGALKSDYTILDLGAGTNDRTLDFFLAADTKIVTVMPEPTSIENAYRFIKSAFYRKFRQTEAYTGLKSVIDEAMDHKNQLGIRSPSDLLKHVYKLDPVAGEKFLHEVRQFHLNILVNQVRTYEDKDLGKSVSSVCRQYFGIEANYLGCLEYDNVAWQALRKKRPLVVDYPSSPLATQIFSIAKSLISVSPQNLKAVV